MNNFLLKIEKFGHLIITICQVVATSKQKPMFQHFLILLQNFASKGNNKMGHEQSQI